MADDLRENRFALSPPEPPHRLAQFQSYTVDLARKHIGQGEKAQWGDNEGPEIDFFRLNDGVEDRDLGQDRVGGSGPWCATFGSFCDTMAARKLGIVCPHKRYRGSKALVRAVVKAGGYYLAVPGKLGCTWAVDKKNPAIPPGSWLAWHRGLPGSPSGHFARVISYEPETDTLTTIEGNHGRPGRAVVAEFTYPAGKWRDRLAAIASYV